jgi:mercuric reductase
MKTIRLEISGMTCEHCARTVERAMESVPGARRATASYSAGRAEAEVEDAVSGRDLIGAVERAGYGAQVLGDPAEPGAVEDQDGAGEGRGFDLLVIGTGAAGMAAAIRGAELGRRVGIVEAGTVGGTCVNVGCIPSKNLLAVAEAAHTARAGLPGLPGCEPTVDWLEIRDRKDVIVGSLRQAKYLDVLDGYPEITLLRGEARMESDGMVEVAGTCHRSGKVVIATGTSPWIPPVSGIEEVDVLTSTTAMELEALPESMIVLGGSAVGLELGQVFARLGVRVTVLELLPHLLAGEEEDAAEELRRHLEAEGLQIVTDVEVRSVERGGTRVIVHGRTSGGDRVFEGERLLAATGRRPSTGSLGLDSAGIETDAKGFIRVDDGMRTSNPTVYAAGDVAGLPGFVYVAAAAGRVAAENAVGAGGGTVDLRAVPRVAFTSPQVASVGVGPGQARERGIEVDVSRLGLEHVPRAIVEHRTEGWIQVVADRESGRILGAQAVAPNAAELLGEATVAVRLGLTIEDVTDTLHPYLTWVEGFKLAVQAFRTDVSKLSCCA